ncbi:MAG TPA: ABC transporter ATP-binding protein [Firmicutes bacterium]|nr:ABC transporter ATP-binding protein [Bacillota bacterium]
MKADSKNTQIKQRRPEEVGVKEASSKLLVVDDLTKVYTKGQGLAKSKIAAVNKVTFSLERDKPEIFTLAGESGSGKSTVAKLILGFEVPTSGSIRYKGKEIAKLNGEKEFMKEVQPVFQNPFETFNPLKKIHTYLYETEKNLAEADQGQLVEESLALVGLSLAEIKDKYPSEMSGGQLQRTSIARALITNPSLLITDEPVSMIDASLRMSIINLFKRLKEEQRVSIIYITHDLATAYYVSDRIAIMLRGEVVEMGSVEEVLDNPLHPYTQLLKASIPVPNPADKWESEIALSDLETKEYLRIGCKFSGRCPRVKAICRECEPENYQVEERYVRCHLYR